MSNICLSLGFIGCTDFSLDSLNTNGLRYKYYGLFSRYFNKNDLSKGVTHPLSNQMIGYIFISKKVQDEARLKVDSDLNSLDFQGKKSLFLNRYKNKWLEALNYNFSVNNNMGNYIHFYIQKHIKDLVDFDSLLPVVKTTLINLANGVYSSHVMDPDFILGYNRWKVLKSESETKRILEQEKVIYLDNMVL